ncbi:MAG: TatD family deoxyribonuclease [Zetaproteobacteria bacterium]|nr:MAG: TatD family deoxyribonuclease [Zetaproteobacteria bacterium]
MELFDSHCHLDFPHFDGDRDQVVARMKEAGVTRAMVVSVDLDHMERLQAFCAGYAGFGFSLGLHPNHEVEREPDVADLRSLAAAHPAVRAIGETGLDYFRHRVDPALQQQRFRAHLEAAGMLDLPVIIHMREADADTLAILREVRPQRGVMHCFSSGMAEAEAALELGLHISFSGNVTFKRNQALREVAARVPLDRLLIETDSPFLAPEPYRGQRNEPAFVRRVAEVVAEARGMAPEELARATTKNAMKLFGMEGSA